MRYNLSTYLKEKIMLISHCDTKRIDEAQVKAVPYTDYTATWHPMHHAMIIRCMEWAVKAAGLSTIDRQYSLSADGANMFAAWSVEGNNPARNWAVGFRNSMKKSFAFGGAAGNKVLVCDNMVFSGDMTFHRRHTAGMTRDYMRMLCEELVKYILAQCQNFDGWFSHLSEVSLESVYDRVLVGSMRQGLLLPSDFSRFENAYQEELDANSSAGTLADFHGAFTRMYREQSLFSVQGNSNKLNSYCDQVIDLVADGDSYTAEWFKRRCN